MKISQRNISLIAAATIILLTIGKMQPINYYPDNSFDESSYSFELSDLDSLEDGIRTATNALDQLKREKESYLTGFNTNGGYTFGPFGIYDVSFSGPPKKENRNFLQLAFIGLKYDDVEFHGKTYLAYQIKKGQPYIITKKLINTGKDRKVIDVYKKVDYLYSPNKNSMFIPINSSFVRVCLFAFGISTGILFLTLSLFVIFAFFKFLLAVAKDKAFIEPNVNRLRHIAIALLILALFQHFINLIIYVIFILFYDSQGVTITKSFFDAEYYALIFAILCYLLYTSFKKAMVLQQENELTI